jgi:hypothetical protein
MNLSYTKNHHRRIPCLLLRLFHRQAREHQHQHLKFLLNHQIARNLPRHLRNSR